MGNRIYFKKDELLPFLFAILFFYIFSPYSPPPSVYPCTNFIKFNFFLFYLF